MLCSRKERYSLELGKIHEAPNMDVFDFKYDFYDERFKCKFEEKFIDYYYFDEIGFETVKRFKHFLRARLNLRMPYYTQLYQTELAAEGIDFLLNKDLTETIIRELDTTDNLVGSNKTISDGTTTTTDNSDTTSEGKTIDQITINENTVDVLDKDTTITETPNTTTTITETPNTTTTVKGSSTDDGKVSNIADGVSNAVLDPQYLTGVQENTNESTNTTTVAGTNTNTTTVTGTNTNATTGRDTDTITKTGNNKQDITNHNTTNVRNTGNKTDKGSTAGENKEDKTGTERERTTLTSQGNIGVTSSAELLEKWRNVIINLDELIILDCRDLFMGIF